MNARNPVRRAGRRPNPSGRRPARRQNSTRGGSSALRLQPRPPEVGPYATVGRDLGGLLGFAPLGERVGGAIGRLFGRGDYKVLSNSLMESYGQPAAGPPPPATFRNGKRGVRIVEREYLGDIISGPLSGSSSAFTNSSYPINPALATSFPWLSTIASRFDQWEPHGIVFEFRSTSSEFNGTSQALGTIVLSTDYDSVDAPYASKVEAENSDYAMSVKSSDCAIHGVECNLTERPTPVLFTRSGPRPAGTDPRMYDLGNFQICTQGMSTAGVNLGELWVSYDITFYKKQLSSPSPESTEFFSFTYADSPTTSTYFGYGLASFKNWGSWDNSNFVTTTRLYLPPTAPLNSLFCVQILYYAAGAAITIPTFTPTGCEQVSDDDLLASAAAGVSNLDVTGIAGFASVTRFYKVTHPGDAYLTASSGTLTNAQSVRTLIQQCNSNVPFPRQPVA